ncbi:MAG: adenine deaminase [Spirochaetaceae bacterium]
MDRSRLIAVATGRRKADLLLENCRVLNVYTGEIEEASVAIDQGLIAGIGEYEADATRDLGGRYLIPGLIDSHVHIESSLLSPEQFALLVLPRGTTTVIADPHEIANVCGLEGIRYMIEAAKEAPLDVFFMLPSCVPATSFENSGAVLDADALASMIDDPAILGLGEMMDYPALLSGAPGALAKLAVAEEAGKPRDGHAPMVLGKELMGYRAAGITSDHECSTLEEMAERHRLGMRVLIREGSAARNLSTLVGGVNGTNASLCAFCTDDKEPADILAEGHIDHNLRLAVERGLDPVTAVQLATRFAAAGYELSDRGAVAPGLLADLAVVEDLEQFRVREVFKGGHLVADNGAPLFSVATPDRSKVSGTVNAPELSVSDLRLTINTPRARVIRVQPGSLITGEVIRSVERGDDRTVTIDEAGQLRKLAVIERHRRTGNIGLALVEGFGPFRGAMATTIAHDSHNLIVLGSNDEDMLEACEEIRRIGGGMAMTRDGEVLASLPLPVAGLMTNEPGEEVSRRMAELNRIAWEELGVSRAFSPFMTLSFLALPVIPNLKLTDIGLFDVGAFDFVPMEAE